VTTSKIRNRPGLSETFDQVLDLEMEIASRRDVAVCQAISVLTAAFFATLDAIAADRKYDAQRTGDDEPEPEPEPEPEQGRQQSDRTCRSLRAASAKLLEEVGFCLCVESLLSCGPRTSPAAKENSMLEDLSDAVQQLNRVTFVCSECDDESGPNECVAITPIESSDLAERDLAYEVRVKLSRNCYAVPMFHKPAEQIETNSADEGEEDAPLAGTRPSEPEPEPEPEPRVRAAPAGEPACFQLLDTAAKEALSQHVVSCIQSTPTAADLEERLRNDLCDAPHYLEADDAEDVIQHYISQSAPQPEPEPQPPRPLWGSDSDSDDEPEPSPELEPELKREHPKGQLRVPVMAVLFSQGVNELQASANALNPPDSLQDKINDESFHGAGGMKELFQRLETKPFWAESISRHRQSLNALNQVMKNKDHNTTDLEILTNASALARGLGCARATHCKSGKDRTSMSVTLEQAAVAIDELQKLEPPCTLGLNYKSKGSKPGKPLKLSDDKTPGKVARQLMRSHGVRREGVRCNLLKGDGKGDR